MSVSENLKEITSLLPSYVKLVAVSKFISPETIMEAYAAGHRIFGENKAQEMTRKHPLLPGDIEWHFIGHLQTNKVKYIVPFVSLVQSVDSLNLLIEINREASRINRTVPCLLQFHISDEETKFGLDPGEASLLLQSKEYKAMHNIRLHGVMGMATFTGDMDQVRDEFRKLKGIYSELMMQFFQNDVHFSEISMGMSGDYKVAVEEGSTIIRVGTAIFGGR